MDGNRSTFSQSEAGDTGETWLRIGLGELYCVAEVTVFWDGVQVCVCVFVCVCVCVCVCV